MELEVLASRAESDTGCPPLLFVHGAYHGAWCWNEHFLPYFSAAGFPAYAVSLRGHGGSGGLDQLHSFTLADYEEDVLKVMSGLEGKPILIGHSMGGAVVQRIMRSHEDQIRAAVLLASVPPQGMMRDLLRLFVTQFRAMGQIQSFNQRRSRSFPVELFFDHGLEAGGRDKYAGLLQPESNKASFELYKSIVKKPTKPSTPLLVLGSRNDRLFPERTVRSIGKAYQTEPVLFDGIGHDLMLDRGWTQVAERILAFLRKTEALDSRGADHEPTKLVPNQHGGDQC